MNGLIGRTRRVLAGLVSAMMVLTSLPMTGVAVYAAPSDNAAYEDQAVAEDTVDETADAVVDEAAVADEAVDAAEEAADEVAEDTEAQDTGDVAVYFTKVSECSVQSISISGNKYTFGSENTVSANVSANKTIEFTVNLATSPAPEFAYVSGVEAKRDDTDVNKFSFTPTEETTVKVNAKSIGISVETDYVEASYETGTEAGCVNLDDIEFSLNSTSDNVIDITDVQATAGNEELGITSNDTGNYVIDSDEVKKAAFEVEDDIIITAEPKTFEENRIHIEDNADVTVTPDEATLVSYNGIYYVKKGAGYSFTVDIKDGVENRRVYQVLCTEKSSTNDFVELENEGNKYTIPEDAIKAVLAGENDAEGFEISVVTVPAKQNITFKANEFVKEISYGTAGDEKNVDMAKATTSGDSVSQDNADFKVIVTPSENALLLSDSFKVGGVAVEAEDDGSYSVSANAAGSVDIEVNAYKKVGVSANNLKSEAGSYLAVISVSTGETSGLTDGDAITFTYDYAPECSDYDVTLAAPVVKYGDIAITPEHSESDIPGTYPETYTIKKSDVEAAIKAGKDIVIEAKGTEIPKAKITFTKTVSTDVVDVKEIEIEETIGKNVYSYTVDSWTTPSGNVAKAEVEVQAGNKVNITGITLPSFADELDTFKKVTKDGSEIEGKNDTYRLGAIAKDTAVVVETAKLSGSAIVYSPTADPDEKTTADMDPITGYVPANKDLSLSFTVNDSEEPVYKSKLKNVKYEVTGGSKGDVSKKGGNAYYLPVSVLREAAFAKTTSSNRIIITSEFEHAGYKPQKLSVVEKTSGSAALKVQANGAYVEGSGSYNITYNAKATATITAKPGFKLDKVYLIKDADKKTASMNVADYFDADKLLEKISASSLPATVVAADSKTGIATVNVKQMDGAYTILVTTSAKEELVIEEIGRDGLTPIHADSNRTYNVTWGKKYKLSLVSGNKAISLSKNSISANYTDGKGGTVPPSVFEFLTTEPLTEVTFNGEAVAGRKVMIKLVKSDGGFKTAEFSVSQKPTEDSVKFADGVVSENVIKEAQPLGTSRTYRLTVGPEIAGLVGIKISALPDGVNVSLKNITDKKGNITKIDMTVSSKAVSPAPASADIMFHDASFYDASNPDVYVFKTVKVNFSTDQVTKADLSEVTAVADTDSITVDFSKAKGFDRATDGLYYKVTISSNEVVSGSVLRDKTDGDMEEFVPASETSRTFSMLKDPSNYDVEPNEITYIVKVELVQLTEDHQTVASSGEQMVSDSVKTKSNGVYAKKIKLVKAKTAPKVIYGSSAGKGTGEFLLATVVYPDVAKNVPVTVKRLKDLVLTDSKGEDWSEKLDYDQNRIYLNPKSLPAGKYTLTAYAVEPKGVDVTGTLKFTVANAINHLDLNVPSNELYKAPGKAASIKATVVYNKGNKSDAPKTKKVKWYLTDKDGHSTTPPAGMTLKNGVVKIAKNAVLPANYTFRIYAEATDFDHGKTPVKNYVKITVTNTPRVPAEIYIGDTQITNGAKIESNDLVGRVQVYDQNEEPIENIKVAVTGVLKKDGRYCWPVNLGKATVTVTTTDGSKKSKKVKFTVDTDEGINGDLDYDAFSFDSGASEYSYVNRNDASYTLPLEILGDDDSFVAHSIKLDGFKKVKVKGAENGFYKLAATKRKAKITITEKANGQSTVINVTNTAIPVSARAAAAKITASNKLRTAFNGKVVDKKGTIFGNLNFTSKPDYDTVSYNKVEYTVKYGKTPAKKDDKVRLYTTTEKIANAIEASGATDNLDGTYTMTLGEGGTFVIDYTDTNGDFSLKPGTYKIQVTPVDDDGFATGKAGTIKVKVVNAPKATVKTLKAKTVTFTGTASANAVADLGFAKQANILISANGDSSASFGAKGHDLDLRGLNVKGKINGFNEMFVIEGGKLKYTGVKSTYYINPKKGISGQIAVSYTGMDGKRTYMYIPITVKGSFK